MLLSNTKTCAFVALALGVSGPVFAKDKEDAGQHIYTPALQKGAGEVFTCRAVNTGKHDEAVDIAILSSEGKVLETQPAVVLKSGFTTSDTATTKNTIAYCRVTVKSSPKDILVTLCSQAAASNACQALVTGQYTTGD